MNTIELRGITEEVMLALADSMASAASHFQAHGYEEFVLARELFVSTNHVLFEAVNSGTFSH